MKGDNSYLYYKDNGKYKLADVDLTSDDIVTGLLKGVGGLLGTLLGGLTVGLVVYVALTTKGYLTMKQRV